jgi:NACHT domain
MELPTSPLTKPGQLREGFQYQDLYGMNVALSWLEHPADFVWVQFEAEEYGYLDDVVVLKSDQRLSLIQIKHVTERPDRPGLTLDDLLQRKTARSRSLFEKWFQSWLSVESDPQYKSIEAVLHTNRPPAEDSAAVLSTEIPQRIEAAKLQEKYSTIFESFRNQAGNAADRLDAFLGTIAFRFNSADIEPTEQILRTRAKELNITSEGFASLLDQISIWSTRRNTDGTTVKVNLDAIKRACAWRKVEKLSEDFPVASDYVPLGGSLLEGFARHLPSLDGGDYILSDVPGAGKSTFLAKLSEYLQHENVPCIRHHYFLGGDDESRFERLNSLRTADALIAELQAFINVSVSPSLEKLKEILTAASAELHKKGRTLVILLDGLDHVLRTEDEDELALLLRQLLPPPPHLSIIFGTRHIPSARVRALFQHVPSDRRYNVPRLNADDCKAMLRAHPAIDIPDHAMDAVATRLAEITEGLPLHAHYCLVQLEALSQQGIVLEHTLDQLVPYGGDLGNYYETIWETLSPETKVLAIVLAVAEFTVPREAMPVLFSGTASDLQRALESLRPFVNETVHGLTLFHASFQEFVSNHKDSETYMAASLERLIQWLRIHAKASLRWRWLNAKEFQAGNPQPLIDSTDRTWIINSIKDGRPLHAIEELLRLACHAAMMQSDYCTSLSRGMSANQIEYNPSANNDIWSGAISMAGLQRLDGVSGALHFSDFERDNSDVLLELTNRAPGEELPAIIDELFERFEAVAYAKGVMNHESALEGAAKYYVSALAVARTSLQDVVAFIRRFNFEPARFAVSQDYISALLSSQQFTNALAAVELVPVTEDQRALLRETITFASFSQPGTYDSQAAGEGLWAQLGNKVILKHTTPARYVWPQSSELPLSIERFKDEERAALSRVFHSAWLNGLVAGATNDHASLDSWIKNVQTQGWSGKTGSHLASMGFAMGEILAGFDLDLCSPLSKLNEVDVITPGDPSWEDYELWISYKRALQNILRDSLALRSAFQQKTFDSSTLNRITSIPGFEEYDQYKLLLSCEAGLLPQYLVAPFVEVRLQALRTRLQEFPERAEAYLEVATLARRTGASSLSERCLHDAIDNLLGYGNHKDIFFYELLRSLELAVQHGVAEVPALLDRVAPAVNVIQSVTDGDETSHLVEEFAGISMQLGSSAMAAAVYRQMMDDERFYRAESVFEKIAELGQLSNVWVRSLLRTSVDSSSRHRIAKRAENDDDAVALAAELHSVDHDPILQVPTPKSSTAGRSRQEERLNLLESTVRDVRSEDIQPQQFVEFCTQHHNDHSLEDFSERWLDFWISKDRKAAYECVTNAMDQHLIRSWSGDLELKLLPSVLEFEGPAKAFEALIAAARAVHVWNSFYTQAEKTETVFNFLKKHFPSQIDTFIRRTVESAGYHKRLGALPVRRGAQFFLLVGRQKDAVDLITAGTERLIELMANLELPPIRWTREESNLLASLFTRLFHVHPEVRSRAAESLGELLLNHETSEPTRREMESRLSACRLESQLITLLYPIAYARRQGYAWSDSELAPHLKERCAALGLVLGSM